jgi:hypothetical protein
MTKEELEKQTMEWKNNYILKLEKENAELKHTIATLRQKKDNVSMHVKAMEVVAKTRSDQLTKAKEHIENLLYYVEQCSCERSNYAELEHDIAEAKQFIKDREVKE